MDTAGILYFAEILEDCVPFPAPGAPIKIKFINFLQFVSVWWVVYQSRKPFMLRIVSCASSSRTVSRITPTTMRMDVPANATVKKVD